MPAAGGVPSAGPSRPSGKLAALVVGAAVVLLVGVGAAVWALTGGDAESVAEVADEAVAAAEKLDVDAGLDLLCKAPSSEDRDTLEEAIDAAREDTGSKNPDVSYRISEVEGDKHGSFLVTIQTDEPGLEGWPRRVVKVEVADRDGRSCIDSFEPVD